MNCFDTDQNCIDTGIFPDSWKKSNIVPVHKKEDKQLLQNYRPVYLLPILGKILEKMLFNSIFEYLQENNLLSENQSGFQPYNSCEYQLLSIVHKIHGSFDCNPPLDINVFLDILKAFNGVWHEGLIYKIKHMGITGLLLKLIQSFLNNRLQRVVLNGQTSAWTQVFAATGFNFRAFDFLIYINDLTIGIWSTAKLFGDTSIVSL